MGSFDYSESVWDVLGLFLLGVFIKFGMLGGLFKPLQ